jgi:putative tryptophan/tyrosine transport system substrate-binding protein
MHLNTLSTVRHTYTPSCIAPPPCPPPRWGRVWEGVKLRRTVLSIIVATALGILLSSSAGAGQPSAKVAKVGVLRLGQGSPAVFEAFQGGLHALGYIEGDTLTFVIREAVGQEAALPKLAAELVQLQVDVIFAGGDAAVRAAKQATRTIPIVMLVSGDPVSSGLVASLNQPGGNVTGVTGLSPRLTARRVEILKQAVPTLSHVAVLFNPDDETKTVDRQQLQVAARALGVRLHSVAIRSPDEFERGFRTMVQEQVNGLIVLSTAFTSFHRTQIIKLAAEHRLPAIYERKEFVEAGGLIAYGPSLPDMLRQAAIYIDNILQGAKPSTLPVEQAKKFELAVNVETANALGLTLPPSILSWADVVMR